MKKRVKDFSGAVATPGKAKRVGRAVVGARRNAPINPNSIGAGAVVDDGSKNVNEGKSHLAHVDRDARLAIKAIAAAVAGLSGLDSGEQQLIASAKAAADKL